MRITKKIKDAMLERLAVEYAGAKPALHYGSPFEFMVAVVLSAQCTDERVNKVTERLFPRLDTPAKMLACGEEQLAVEIHDCGLFRSKARNLIAACQMLLADYGGDVPHTEAELLRLPGVGRKTANVLLSVLFGVPALAVDTHVFRVANRTQLGVGKTAEAVEAALKKTVPREHWSEAHHWLIWHGRRVCRARSPLCRECLLADLCPATQT